MNKIYEKKRLQEQEEQNQSYLRQEIDMYQSIEQEQREAKQRETDFEHHQLQQQLHEPHLPIRSTKHSKKTLSEGKLC